MSEGVGQSALSFIRFITDDISLVNPIDSLV